MQFKIGDKVRFLNEKGEGVISGFLNKTTVNVQVEGFDIPYPVTELVPVQGAKPAEQKNEVPTPAIIHEDIPEIKEAISLRSDFSKGVYILFVPEGKNMLESPLQLMISNYTEYDVLYSLSVRRGSGYVTISTGDISSGKNNAILLISRSELERFSHIKADLLYYSQAEHQAQPPVSEIVRINPVRLYKENNFIKTPFLPKRVFIACIAGMETDNNWENVEIDPDHLSRAMKQKRTEPSQLSKPHSLGNPEIEVDLHIEELMDSHAGMNNAQILDVQLRHFKRELEKAIDSHAKKITFIHGVGVGRLKQEIHNILKTYDRLRFHDAPYSKYGFGATEVVLR